MFILFSYMFIQTSLELGARVVILRWGKSDKRKQMNINNYMNRSCDSCPYRLFYFWNRRPYCSIANQDQATDQVEDNTGRSKTIEIIIII